MRTCSVCGELRGGFGAPHDCFQHPQNVPPPYVPPIVNHHQTSPGRVTLTIRGQA